jgi:HEAT repeat protein
LSAADPSTETKADVKALLAQLRSKDAGVRIRAVQALGEKGDDAKPAVRALCSATLDTSAKVKQAALEALEKVRPDLYKPLVVVLREGNRSERGGRRPVRTRRR